MHILSLAHNSHGHPSFLCGVNISRSKLISQNGSFAATMHLTLTRHGFPLLLLSLLPGRRLGSDMVVDSSLFSLFTALALLVDDIRTKNEGAGFLHRMVDLVRRTNFPTAFHVEASINSTVPIRYRYIFWKTAPNPKTHTIIFITYRSEGFLYPPKFRWSLTSITALLMHTAPYCGIKIVSKPVR